jgi:RAVE protein 1 C terminal
MRSFYILNERASAPNSSELRGAINRRTGWRARLRFRDIIWAFHSESQGLLLTASLTACQGKMTWSDARALGVFLWLNSVEAMVSHACVLLIKIGFSISVDTLAEIAHGSHRSDGVYGWRCS